MAKRIGISKLNASSMDIINTIRANAGYEYQQNVPKITDPSQIPMVGEVIMGYPAYSNTFLNALLNRIALVVIRSSLFNNPFVDLKKGYLEFGETIEEVFVNVVKAREFSVEKAEARELKRSLPDVRAAFHTINYKAQYPITIQYEDLRQAFLTENGMQDLVRRVFTSVYQSANYDEYLLFKYVMIKAIAHGKVKVVPVDSSDIKNAAVTFRGYSNKFEFLSTDFNEEGVHTSTVKNDQQIFMSAMYNAEYDVNVLASAFNMEKADFMGRLRLIDDWGTFDNDRFSELVADGQMEEVTADELAISSKVIGVLADREFFQFYDNNSRMTEKEVASGQYWNYFYNDWKTVSTSPFSNFVAFVSEEQTAKTFALVVDSVETDENGTTITCFRPADSSDDSGDTHYGTSAPVRFVQDYSATVAGVAVHRYGAYIVPKGKSNAVMIHVDYNGKKYVSTSTLADLNTVGAVVTMNLSE